MSAHGPATISSSTCSLRCLNRIGNGNVDFSRVLRDRDVFHVIRCDNFGRARSGDLSFGIGKMLAILVVGVACPLSLGSQQQFILKLICPRCDFDFLPRTHLTPRFASLPYFLVPFRLPFYVLS